MSDIDSTLPAAADVTIPLPPEASPADNREKNPGADPAQSGNGGNNRKLIRVLAILCAAALVIVGVIVSVLAHNRAKTKNDEATDPPQEESVPESGQIPTAADETAADEVMVPLTDPPSDSVDRPLVLVAGRGYLIGGNTPEHQGLPLVSGPDGSYRVIDVLPEGAAVVFTGYCANDYASVDYTKDGTTLSGYLWVRYLTESGGDAPSAPAATTAPTTQKAAPKTTQRSSQPTTQRSTQRTTQRTTVPTTAKPTTKAPTTAAPTTKAQTPSSETAAPIRKTTEPSSETPSVPEDDELVAPGDD